METLPLSEMKDHLSELIGRVQAEQAEITVTKNGYPAAVVVSADEWEGLQDTLEILADQDAVLSLVRAKEEDDHGELIGLEEARPEIEEAIRARRGG